jgi:UDP-4-amino-4,6-dideoxy-N-acetyl-beta-L-altrosamine N-acetyltransferase
MNFRYNEYYLRVINETDLEKIRQHRNEFDTWKNLTDGSLISKDQQDSWFRKLSHDSSRSYFIAGHEVLDPDFPVAYSEDLGLIRVQDIEMTNKSCAVGLDVFKEYRRKGYGLKIMEMLCEYEFSFLNMNRLWLLVAEYNEHARKIYEKIGFKQEGIQREAIYRFGKYNDYIMMSLLKHEWKK